MFMLYVMHICIWICLCEHVSVSTMYAYVKCYKHIYVRRSALTFLS